MTWVWPWTLNSLKYLIYILIQYPRSRNLGPFCPTSHFWDTKLRQIGKALNDLSWPWTFNSKKVPIYYKYAQGPNSTQFCSTTSRFWDTRLSKIGKSEMHRTTSELLWALNIYTISRYLSPMPKICSSFRATTCRFEDISHFIIPHWLLCYPPPTTKKKKKNKTIAQIW